ncbi:MAG: PAS domain S-box protein [Gemmatimonadaceae bacterium]
MADTLPTANPGIASLDARIRALLREVPREQATLLEAHLLDRDREVAAAERRAERVQRLHEAASSLLRSLDRDELELEVALQLLHVVHADGVIIARPPVAPGDAAEARVHVTPEGPASLDSAEPLAIVFDEVVRTGRPARVAGRTEGPASLMASPIMQGFRLVGLIGVYSSEARGFSDEDLDATQTLATHAATALVNAALYAQSERERRQSGALASLAQALGSAARLPDVLRLGLRHAIALFGTEGADIALRRDEFLQIVSAEGAARPLQGMFLPMNASVSGRAVREARVIATNDAATDPDSFEPTRRLASIKRSLVAPMLTAGQAVGVLGLVNRERPFDAEDGRMLQQFASQLAVAIVNARLYDEAAEAQREISAAFEAIGDGIVVLDAEARVVRYNARFLEIAGLPSADGARGRDFYDTILHEARELTEETAVGQAILGPRLAREQLRSAWNGRVLEILAAPHPGTGGAVVSVNDMTAMHALAEQHRLVVENTTDAILITSAEGVVEFANPAAHRLFGAADELVGARIGGLVPASEATVWAEAIARSRRGDAARIDGTVVPADGNRRQVSVRLAPMAEDQHVHRLVITLRDVTDEVQARDEMLVANARYRDLVEMAAEAIVTLDTRGTITSVNPAGELVVGHHRGTIVGRSYHAFLEPVESKELEDAFNAAVAGKLLRVEMHLTRDDGDRRLLAVSLSPMRRAGVVVGVLGVARDVTEEREHAAALERAEERYTRLVEAAEDAIVCVDEEGNLTAVNRAMEHVAGKTRDELLGRPFAELVDASEAPAMWQGFVSALAGKRERTTIRFTRPGGVRGYATLNAAPIVEGGRVTGVLAIARDVTDERLLLDQAIRQDRMVAMGELVGGVAHEVNSPLTSILAYAQVLERGVGGEDAARAMETITREAKRASRIVGKLLAFGRQGQAERIPTDVNQALRDTIDLRRYALRMQEIKLSVALMPDPPLVLADPFQLQQVFINLLSNAEQAVAHQPGERCLAVASEVRGSSFVVTISDNGPGIAPEALPHIFNPFFTTKPRGAGTGLGLSISDGIIREHRGVLRARSDPGQGATFEVELPLTPAT